MSTNDNTSLHLPIVGFALLTSVLVALANLIVENITTINVFSISVLFVIPLGAIIIGAGGASGGLLAARYFNIKPNKIDFFVLVLVAALTMYFIYYLGYITLVLEDGTKASTAVSFSDYVDVITTKSHMRIGRGSTDVGEVGSLGYWLIVVKFIGVLLGSVAIFATLKGSAMCTTCNVYYKKIATKESKNMNSEQAQDVFNNIREGTIDAYKLALTSDYIDTTKDENKVKVKFTLMRCPKCNHSYVQEEFFVIDKNGNTKEMADFGGKTNIPTDSDLAISFKK